VEHLVHTRAFGNGLTLLAWLGENPVGLLMMGVHLDSRLFRHRSWAELLALYIVPDLRGGALSERLLALGTAWARERGHERIQLYVTSSNERAKQFYARAGFQAAQEIWRLELGDVPTLQESDRADEMREPNPLSAHTHYVLLDQDEV
jgi:ribosomal protein S18 acetylase RimI-like enzyme